MKDYNAEFCPQKEEVRHQIAKYAPEKIGRGIWLPSAQCLDIKLMKSRGNISSQTKVVACERDKKIFKLMVHNLKNKIKIDNLEVVLDDLENYKNNENIDFAHFDFVGFFSIRKFKWLAKYVAPFVNHGSVIVITVLNSYRDEIVMPEFVKTLKSNFYEDSKTCGYKTYIDALCKKEDKESLCEQEHQYFGMPHFMLRSIFRDLCPKTILTFDYQDSNPMSGFILKDFDYPQFPMPNLYEIIATLPEDIEHKGRLRSDDPGITWGEVLKQKRIYEELLAAYREQKLLRNK
jgi:hypothetical protein